MKYIILLSLLFNNCRSESTDVKSDIKNTKDTIITIYRYGLPNFELLAFEREVGEKWGIVFYEQGCVIDSKIERETKINNKKAYQLLEEKYGKDWKEKFYKEVATLKEEKSWSAPVNGLSAKVTFGIEKNESSNVIHPKLHLRNDSNEPINFFWCVYEAGDFIVKQNNEPVIYKYVSSRSGPVGSEVLTIKPNEIVVLDAHDYGYGAIQDNKLYAFNTSSYQTHLKSNNNYYVDYSLKLDAKKLEHIIKKYSIDNNIKLWKGNINLKDIPLIIY